MDATTTKKKRGHSRSKTSPHAINEKTRQYKALELRLQHKSFPQIAQELGYSDKGSAWNAVMIALRDVPVTNAEDLRAEQNAVIDAVLAELWPDRKNPTTAHAILRYLERRARLMGIDLDPKASEMLQAALAAASASATANVFIINGEKKRPEDLTFEELDIVEAHLVESDAIE